MQLNSKAGEEERMQLHLEASASEEETLTDYYRVLRTLGKGSFAEVKLACHLHTEVQVAVKILKKDNNKTEIEIIKVLEHPNIIKLFHIINTREHTYMVMEHAAHGDLVSHIEKVGCLQEKQAQHIFTQLVCAVHYCHNNGIAHRDIKLDNILLDGKGNIKLCDFGLAIRVTDGEMVLGFCGTVEYCAPELFTDREYDAKAVDIWSMGVVLYTIVTAQFPFNAYTYSDMKEEMLSPTLFIPATLSENIANLIVQLLTMEPGQRPKIGDIKQHQWLKDREEFWKLPSSLATHGNNPSPSIVVTMWDMGYRPKDICDCIHKKNFNNIMATYLILKHGHHTNHPVKSIQGGVAMSPARALTSLLPLRAMSEPALSTLTCLPEHHIHNENRSRNKGSRKLSMPTTLCLQQYGVNLPKLRRRCAPNVTYLVSKSVKSNIMCKGVSSRCPSQQGISSVQSFSQEALHKLNIPSNSSYTLSTPPASKSRESPQRVTSSATNGTQRPSLQATTKENFKCVPPKGGSTHFSRNLSQGWKRVKKRIWNCMQTLCCCLPVSKRSHISQKEVVPRKVEGNRVTYSIGLL
ncbi:sperm motility kinase-like [Meriones unguiculatus]|uniref:sperm motility kinase-like n=1 Tax=Meriones unguiculatus TaxID=10047 RepID=UPI00293E9120|nr:sperm motility kinase-like [Meriones unguiculatus]